ncbi:RasGTPase-activating protein, partial [Reticulomyxa filosa]
MNRPWEGPKNLTAEEAAEDKYVKRLVASRVRQLEYVLDHFLTCIVESVDLVPFGIRWICRQLAEMTQKRFPDVDRYKIGGLVGGFIYLRFFNPVIVAPESVNFVDHKLSNAARRNLILIAKILQTLSNGVDFRDQYMKVFSPWVEKHREDLQIYFARLIDVDPLFDHLDIDDLVGLTKDSVQTVQVTFNQIFLLHRLLWQHRKVWNKSKDCNDPVLKILATLGAPPGPVKFSDNHLINLQLRCLNNNNDDDDDDDNNNSNGDDYDHKSNHLDSKEDNKNNMARDYIANVRVNEDALVNQVREKIKTILVNDSVPEMLLEQCRTSLRTYLQ